jgi:glycyl-tRNA synthetase beta subunit
MSSTDTEEALTRTQEGEVFLVMDAVTVESDLSPSMMNEPTASQDPFGLKRVAYGGTDR